MHQDDQSVYTSHDNVWLLLPWHVNGSLFEQERPMVENHMKICVTCRIEYERLTKLSKRMAETETSDMVAASSFNRLKQKIQSDQGTDAVSRPENSVGQLVAWLRNRTFAFRLVTSLGVISVFTALMFVWQQEIVQVGTEADYRTLSSKTNGQFHDKVIGIKFAEGVTKKQIKKIIASLDGTILDGTENDTYFKVSMNQSNNFKQLIAAVERLEMDPRVVYARPVFP